MKTLLLVVFLAGVSYADQAADSFGTGFAQALQRALEAKQGQSYEAPQQEILNTYPIGHYDVRDNYGNLEGYSFATYTQCDSYIRRVPRHLQCVWVGH